MGQQLCRVRKCGPTPAGAPGQAPGPLHTPRTPGTSLAHGQAAPSVPRANMTAERPNATCCTQSQRMYAHAKGPVVEAGSASAVGMEGAAIESHAQRAQMLEWYSLPISWKGTVYSRPNPNACVVRAQRSCRRTAGLAGRI